MKHRSNVNRRNTQALRPPSNAATHASRLYVGRCPPLPEDHYKVVYRPRTGMKLSKWADEKISEGIARACEYAFRDFCANVITQTQWRQNLIITSTGDEDYALKLAEVTSIHLGKAKYELHTSSRFRAQFVVLSMESHRVRRKKDSSNC
ncbi:hypothetical protein MTO96_042683 [Rhipicephalus appendiculatus]